ncbi:MAG: protein kinase [Acidobacteriota bacterium]|nr:protein kinase [Acidobacteriota bacterium]
MYNPGQPVQTVPSPKPDRWQRIETLFYEALDMNPGSRSAFLDEACGSDFDLRREAESLLESAEKIFTDPAILEGAVHEAAHSFLSVTRESIAGGTCLDHYEVVRMIGAGGMGEVYLAKDLRLKRKVALRFLSPQLTLHPGALRRFELEAQAVSALNHPNILTIFEFCQVDGRYFIAAEFVEGQTLRRLLNETGKLEQRAALDVAIQMAAALEAAHASGVIHRDIKPENVMVRPDGVVKILDFGIAKLNDPGTDEDEGDLTKAGVVLGTAKYMSPEQARGLAVDARTDLFSLGAVLYEAATARGQLERIIKKAHEQDRERRYQSARELLSDLRALKRRMESPRWLSSAALLFAAIIVIGLTLIYTLGDKPRSSQLARGPRSIAVLPFRNVRHDPQTEFLGFSLADSIITKLGYVSALTVRPSSSVERYRNGVENLRGVASELNVDMLLTGTFIKDGDQLRITTQLIDVKPNTMLWQDTLDIRYDKLLSVQDSVAQSIINGLELKLSPVEAEHLKSDPPVNGLAYEYYLRGVDLYSIGDFAMAISMLEKSLSLEPNDAPAWAHLGRTYTTNASLQFGGREQYRKAQAAYEKAIALNPALPEPRIYMANLFTDTGRVEEAAPLLRVALESSPNNAEAHWELGYAYRFGGMLRASVAECELARRLDPEVKINSSALNSYLYLGEYDKFLKSLPANDSSYILFYRGFAEYYKGNKEEAAGEFDRAFELTPSLLQAQVGKSLSYGLRHQEGRGLELLRQTEKKIDENGVSDAEGIYKVAQGYAVLGDKDSAMRVLGRSIEGGFFCASYFERDKLLDSLHGERRFEELLGKARDREQQFAKRFGNLRLDPARAR